MSAKTRRALKLQEQDKEALEELVAKQLLESAVKDPEARRLAQEVLDRNGDRRATKPAASAGFAQRKDSKADMYEAYLELYNSALSASSPEEWIQSLETDHNSAPLMDMLQTIFGVEGRSAAHQLFSEVGASVGTSEYRQLFLSSLEMMRSLAPKGAAQAMLATQMLAVHSFSIRSMAALANSSASTNPQQVDMAVNQAMKLMRVFAQQTELLGRLQGKITSQRIVVEKVDVRDGGQAMVGVVESNRGGGKG